MATLAKTYTWATDAESFTFNSSDASVTGTYDSTNESLECDLSGNNKVGIGTWSRTLTFEDMGVPTNSTISSITATSAPSHAC